MKMHTSPRALTSALLLALATTAGAAEATNLTQALEMGKVSLNIRARYEDVSETTKVDAQASTLRTRIGFTTAPLNGFKAMIEAENIVSPSGDKYNQAGLNPAAAARAVVADPEGSEINQAFVSYTSGATTATVGRQRLVFDNARFVGDVAWRQNMQTFDGLVVANKSVDKLALSYAYLSRINRVFGDRLATGNWDSDSHLANASYTGLPGGTLTGYAYLLNFSNAAAQSSATYGLSYTGATAISDAVKVTYRAEYATQSDYGDSALNYSTDYYTLELGASAKIGALAVGYESLGSDAGKSFRTPLATLHAFNGWADMFLTTPASGLTDTYVKVSANLPEKISLLAFYHAFKSEIGSVDYGKEFDVQLVRKFGKYFTGTLKYADFNSDLPATYHDVRKFWAQVEFAY